MHLTLLELGYFRTNFLTGTSLSKTTNPLPAYDNLQRTYEGLAIFHGTEIGNPDRCAKAILEVARMANPPLRLVLGSDALALARTKLDQQQDNLARHESLTLSTDYES